MENKQNLVFEGVSKIIRNSPEGITQNQEYLLACKAI